MGLPTEAELVQLNEMRDLAKLLKSGKATQPDRDRSTGLLLELYIAERRLGLIAVPECAEFREKCSGGWNRTKAIAVVTCVVVVCTAIVSMTT